MRRIISVLAPLLASKEENCNKCNAGIGMGKVQRALVRVSASVLFSLNFRFLRKQLAEV